MATPTDDDLRTIGLPYRAAQEVLKGFDPSKKAADRPPAPPRPPEVDELLPRRGTPKPGVAPAGESPAQSPPLDTERDMHATVPPPGRRRDEREIRPPAGSSSPADPRARSRIGPADVRPRENAARPQSPEPAARREPAPRPPVERSLDELDHGTAALPGPYARPGSRPAPSLTGDHAEELGVPLGDDTCYSPVPAIPPAAPSRPPEPKSRPTSETSQLFPNSDLARRPGVAPSRPAYPAGLRDRIDVHDGEDKTRAYLAPLAIGSGTRSIIQFFHNTIGRWSDLGEARREGNVVGRYTFQAWDANPDGLAEEHLVIGYEGDELYVEPLPTLNGVYRKLQPNRREELLPQSRFRIGRHVMTFRLADPPAEIAPRRSDDGEVFQSRVLAPLGFVDLIGPDGNPYLSFPVTKRDERGTRIGRAGVECDIALTGDEWVSLRHARIGVSDGKCWIEDLESTNGTFLIIGGRTPLRRGSAQFPATGDEILVGGYKIRVIAEKV